MVTSSKKNEKKTLIVALSFLAKDFNLRKRQFLNILSDKTQKKNKNKKKKKQNHLNNEQIKIIKDC